MESLLPLLCVVLSLSVAAAHPFGLPNCTLRTISQNVRLEQTKCALANLFTVHRQVDHFGYDAWVNDTFEQRYFTYDFSAEPGRRSRCCRTARGTKLLVASLRSPEGRLLLLRQRGQR